MISILRVIKFAFQNFWRNFWLSIITISMLILTLLTVNILLVLNVLSDQTTKFVENRVEVSVYFNKGVTDIQAANAADSLRDLNQVRDVEVITADEAIERFRDRHANQADVLKSLEEVGENPFGPTLVVRAKSVADFDLILQALDNPQFSKDIRERENFTDYKTLIDRVRTITSRVRLFGFSLAAIFLFITLLIVFNTVRMSIFIHREEIGVMKLVGASNWFIRAPFLLEIVLYGLIATVFVAAVTLPSVAVLDPYFSVYFDGPVGILSFFQADVWRIFALEFGILSLVSMTSTSLAMRQYLKV
ncbi:ABC transporter permease [Candidatus Uhrbacteria bacterium]|nr:ABC transporter permease [Candidatus Uhrbacteria bacterium]